MRNSPYIKMIFEENLERLEENIMGLREFYNTRSPLQDDEDDAVYVANNYLLKAIDKIKLAFSALQDDY